MKSTLTLHTALVSPTNDKAYMLDAPEAVNRAWAKEMKQSRLDP